MSITIDRPTQRSRATGRSTGTSRFMSVWLPALGGVLFFTLITINASLRSGFPSATDPGQEIFDSLAQHQGRLQVIAVLLGFAMPAALLWLSGLYRVLRRAEGGHAVLALAAAGGGVLAATSTVTGALIAGTIATRINDLGPSAVGTWWTMFLMSTGGTLLGLLLLIGATVILCIRMRLFARWFSVASVVLALASGVGSLAIGYDATGIQVVAGLAVLLDSGWILLISVFLWRDRAPAPY